MTIALESMALEMPEVKRHPNRAAFRGVLTMVDVPSKRAPSGSNGRRVVLTRAAAEAALPSLLGMALDYAPSFDRHDVQRKVGVITSAEIVGNNLEVGGYLYAKDFPEVVREIERSAGVGRQAPGVGAQTSGVQSQARELRAENCGSSEGTRLRTSLRAAVERLRSLTAGLRREDEARIASICAGNLDAAGAGLGMSYEVTNVVVADRRPRVWTLSKVTFTGAAILRRNKAAYEDTWIALSPES
ncbi:MAG TPA: hypothetical protein VMH04_19175 [Candidatus Solibacter sp.]|nr:hypothetical protein [Candidatus Solibacter sp.]